MQKIKANILNEQRGIIVHGCNLFGVAGGFAGAVFQMYEKARTEYLEALARANPIHLGDVVFTVVRDNLIIASAITQTHPGSGTLSYGAIRQAFATVNEYANRVNRDNPNPLPIIFPAIGSGIAGGDWAVIESIIN
jgi:O-acetyl-ADP-ribose deacetylase (regulator of RNase III)